MTKDVLTPVAEATANPSKGAAARGRSRSRVDYCRFVDLVDDGVRAQLEDGPAYATTVIRRAIVTGALKPGDPVRQDLMASALSLSKPPVREALRKLESEQLVTFLPNCGFVVAPEGPTELREAYELRTLLEPALLRMAAPNLTKEDFRQARHYMELLVGKPNYLTHFDLNQEFHLTLYRPSLRPHFLQIVIQAMARTQRYVYPRLHLANLVDETPDDGLHQIILARLERGDVEGACEALEAHIKGVSERLLKMYWRTFEVEEYSGKVDPKRRTRR